MSEELRDEVEAINSIYGDKCLRQTSDDASIYILTPPGESVSLRVQFPAAYPDEPPSVIGTNSIGDGKRGAATRELQLFRDAVGNVFQPGMVCLFDAIEELNRRLEEVAEAEAAQTEETTVKEDQVAPEESHRELNISDIPEPPWVLSEPIVELKSTFLGRCAAVSSTIEAEAFVNRLLATDRKARDATHNMTAWRIRGPNGMTFQDCDDDGEDKAGGRLLHLMQLMDLWDVMIVVSRWYGGHHLGPRRFALINQAARDAFERAGLVPEKVENKKKGPSKG